jgi:hypothetical protein
VVAALSFVLFIEQTVEVRAYCVRVELIAVVQRLGRAHGRPLAACEISLAFAFAMCDLLSHG